MKTGEIPGHKHGGYIPKYYVFRGFHLSTWISQFAFLTLSHG